MTQSVDTTVPEAGPMMEADAAVPPAPVVVSTEATSCAGNQKAPGISTCGASKSGTCCDSPNVAGGTFLRDYDGVTHNTKSYPATVGAFRLDTYEATVGRFRSFTAAALAGWSPAAGSGKHTHLNGGKGLRGAAAGEFESGWDTRWTASLAKSSADWNKNLGCSTVYQTWTPDISGDETRPINCASWFEAYAFCIWDNGFLPTEAEWDYAAAGGAEQRTYPWASPPASADIDCTMANFGGLTPPGTACNKSGPNSVGSQPKGNGKWGQADLAGNVWEWTLDWSSGYAVPCQDCANLNGAGETARGIRGGGFSDDPDGVLASYGLGSPPDARDYTIGVRCARSPVK